MCGIFGGYKITKQEVDTAILKINRGNDGITTTELTKDVVFSARRHLVKKSGNENNSNLSDQPYYSNDKTISLIFNGEFYNFDKYKSDLEKEKIKFSSIGDTEVFLKLYEKNGISFVNDKNIDSLFALAIYDSNKRKIFITRDWPGRIPLYYYHDQNVIYYQ